MLVSHLLVLFAYCVVSGNCILDGCDDYIKCTTHWFIQTSLEFKKGLVYRDFVLKDTELLV